MARRRMTLRRIDPWSVLKFGAVVNVCLFVIVLLGSLIVWFAIRQLGIIDQACGLATDVGFENCAVNGGNLFRYLVLLGLLWVVIQTGLFVFFAFLHNLIADLVGGISVTMSEEGAITAAGSGAGRTTARRAESRPGGEQTTQRSGLGVPPPREPSPGASTSPAGTGGPPAGSAAAATGGSYASPSSGPADERTDRGSGRTPYDGQAPAAPPTTAPRQPSEPRPSSSGGWPWDPQPGQSDDASGGGGSERDERGREDPEDPEDRDDDRLFGRRDER